MLDISKFLRYSCLFPVSESIQLFHEQSWARFYWVVHCNGFGNRRFFLTFSFLKSYNWKGCKRSKKKVLWAKDIKKIKCNSGDFFRSILTFTILLFKNLILKAPTMLSIPKTRHINEEMKTKKINCKLLAGNAIDDSTTIEELSIICGFAILLQWTMELVDQLKLMK